MENREQYIDAVKNSRIRIGIIPGHFATNHSHVNYYLDMTTIKTSHKMAMEAAKELAGTYSSTYVDTIICLEGTEMLGAYLAKYLGETGINNGSDISVIKPEVNSNNQLLFRDNTQKMIWGKQILLLISSASTGKSIKTAVECLQYYNGTLAAIGAIFSAIKEANGIDVHAVFHAEDLPKYETFIASQCPICQAGRKLDAIVNSYGYSKI